MCKLICLIRKNSLFSESPKGAASSCFLMTLINTAIANNINPKEYLRCLFEQTPYAKTEEDWQRLLPCNIEITPFKIEGKWVRKNGVNI